MTGSIFDEALEAVGKQTHTIKHARYHTPQDHFPSPLSKNKKAALIHKEDSGHRKLFVDASLGVCTLLVVEKTS